MTESNRWARKALHAMGAKQEGFVWLLGAVYVILLLIVLFRTTRYGYGFPFSDDWAILPHLTRVGLPSWDALLAAHNEHRIPLPRLFWLATFKLTAGDFRWMAIGNTVLLTVGGVYLNVVLARARGSVAWTDTLVPISLFSFAHVSHFWLFQAMFALSTFGLIILLGALSSLDSHPLGHDRQPLARVGVLAGLAICFLSGAQGLLPASVMALYLTIESSFFLARKRDSRTRPAWLSFCLLGLILAACLLLVVATPRLDRVWGTVGPGSAGLAVLKMTVAPFGLKGLRYWPWTLAVPFGLLALCAWHFVGRFRDRAKGDQEAVTAQLGEVRLGMMLMSQLVLFVALGVGRGGRGELPIPHYAVLAIPTYLCLYLWAERYGTSVGRAACRVLVGTAFVGGFVLNFSLGFEWGRANLVNTLAFERSVLAGGSAEEIAAEHMNAVFFVDAPWGRALVARGLRILKDGDITPYQCVGARNEPAARGDLPAFCLQER